MANESASRDANVPALPDESGKRLSNIETGNEGKRLPDEFLSNIGSFQEAFATLTDNGLSVEDWADYGTGFSICEDKNTLVGKPFLALEWRFNPGKFGYEFVSIMAVTESDEKVIINDGSTGICAQLRALTDQRLARGMSPEAAQKGMLFRHGLTRSDYDYVDESTGTKIPASTFYLAN